MAGKNIHIRARVARLLKEASITEPPVPVEDLIRRQGIDIARKHLDDETSGFVFVDSTTKSTVIGLNISHSRTRQRFTLAHELGHFLMHNSGDQLHVDDRDFFVRFRDSRSRDGSDLQEREANGFAAELLMPSEFLERDAKRLKDGVSLSDEKAMRALATKYGVSLQALAFRLVNLKLLDAAIF